MKTNSQWIEWCKQKYGGEIPAGLALEQFNEFLNAVKQDARETALRNPRPTKKVRRK